MREIDPQSDIDQLSPLDEATHLAREYGKAVLRGEQGRFIPGVGPVDEAPEKTPDFERVTKEGNVHPIGW